MKLKKQTGLGTGAIFFIGGIAAALSVFSYVYFMAPEWLLIPGEANHSVLQECENPAPNNTCIDLNGMDSFIIGKFFLQSQVVEAQGHSIESKFLGRTLEFHEDGTYTEDYATESTEAKVINNPTKPITSHCKVEGIIMGYFRSEYYYNPSNPNLPAELHVGKNSGSLKVLCLNGEGNYVKMGNNTASIPLGVGPVSEGGEFGTYVKYTYSFDSVTGLLRIIQKNQHTGVIITYIFKKI